MRCEWFALCQAETQYVVAHPILGWVPTCSRCAKRFDLEQVFRITRDNQEHDTVYACTDGTHFVVAPDGVGRYWYDTMDELEAQHGEGLPFQVLDHTPDD